MKIHEVNLNHVVELNLTTVDSETDEAEAGVVSDLNVILTLKTQMGYTSFFRIRQQIPFSQLTIITAKHLRNK